MADDEKKPSLLNRLFGSLPEGAAVRAGKKAREYNVRQRQAIEEAMNGSSDSGRNGVDAGEMGKKWDDQFPK